MEIIAFIIIILVASVLQTSTGFGFSILATPFLLLLFKPIEAIQINLILSLFKLINQTVFRIFTYIILLFTGIYLLIESLGVL